MTLLDVRFPPSAWNARKVRDHLVHIGATLELEAERLEEFVTAVGEAFANAVEHSRTDTEIRILVKLDARRRLLASIRDRGCGIDASEVNRTLPPVKAERGRGIALMRRCSSRLKITLPRGGGTLVELRWDGDYRRASRIRSRSTASVSSAAARVASTSSAV
ncbi:MAG: ATP-binding protein [Vulcanimicrobiaceae bacterium]